MDKQQIARMIDHTLLKADATKEAIVKLAEEAKQYKFASVCVNPANVATAYEVLRDTPDVKVCTVIGFPLGASTPEVKAFGVKDAIANGATEVDMVINIGALKDKQDELVERDIRAVVEAAHGKALTKVIIETCLLSEEEKVRACKLSVRAGADFVKTSTGFSTGGATAADISLMRQTVGPDIGVKASGGIRSYEDFQAMVAAGATRIGASSGVAIMQGEQSSSTY
ncbi:deoxyribose-phosphate aldolase [Paenibacillus albiflavus]|uniref:Deoxyribose-phosphate aldolase n=1 Tax=Paenibacillus albiflavus TaxID=2545760 RepID=A0A4R4EBA4_9BACL|nr:deoxyribose-phosphate aldolase [Paenibacillus albiflavus]TCZ75421.1 deoxyribose-phosphate aldolase [Paenibacillus albiflavus]